MQVRIDEVKSRSPSSRAADARSAGRPAPRPRAARSARPLRAERGGRLARRDPALGAHRPGNRLERCKVKDPSVNNWPAIVEAVQGNIIADFPVINKSFNLSYSGTDR
jgi:hypothetical protein